MAGPAPIGIVLVNWNRWTDTIECLESVLRSDVPVRVVVVDNLSSDHSLDRIEAWTRGEIPASASDAAMARFGQPPVPKPVDCERLAAAALETQGIAAKARLTLVDSGANRGFAGGNNVGLKLLLADPEITHFWLLNNDTVIAPDAARKLQQTLAGPGIGMAGTMVRFYHRPDRVQAWAGSRFSVLTGQSRGIGYDEAADTRPDPVQTARQLDFVLGASLAVTRPFLERVGLMEERYFLYYEEIDWAVRNRRHPQGRFALGFAAEAVVWHKEGGSIGSSGVKAQRSSLSDYWLNRSRLTFTARHYPWLLPVHQVLTLSLVARRLLRGQPAKAKTLLRALFGRGFSP